MTWRPRAACMRTSVFTRSRHTTTPPSRVRTTSTASSTRPVSRCGARAACRCSPLQLAQHRRCVADFELARCLVVERVHLAVLHELRVTRAAHAHAACGEVEREAGGFGKFGAAVCEHADLAGSPLITCPRPHHERVVDAQTPD